MKNGENSNKSWGLASVDSAHMDASVLQRTLANQQFGSYFLSSFFTQPPQTSVVVKNVTAWAHVWKEDTWKHSQ